MLNNTVYGNVKVCRSHQDILENPNFFPPQFKVYCHITFNFNDPKSKIKVLRFSVF
jgi:hypothetical protein